MTQFQVRMDPQPPGVVHAIVQIDDPWHQDAFVGTPAEGIVRSDGPRAKVWAAEDAWSNIVGTFTDVPAGAVGAKLEEGAWFWECELSEGGASAPPTP